MCSSVGCDLLVCSNCSIFSHNTKFKSRCLFLKSKCSGSIHKSRNHIFNHDFTIPNILIKMVVSSFTAMDFEFSSSALFHRKKKKTVYSKSNLKFVFCHRRMQITLDQASKSYYLLRRKVNSGLHLGSIDVVIMLGGRIYQSW